jgi:hypothetical protein
VPEFLSRREILLLWAAPSPPLCEAAKFFDFDLKNETERSALNPSCRGF